MPSYSNTSYAAKNVGTSPVTITTVPSATTIAIASLVVANTTTSPITCDVYYTRSAVNYYLVKSAVVPVGSALEVIQGNRIVLIASDILVAVTSAASSAAVTVSVLTAA